jgi:hypothetical protein
MDLFIERRPDRAELDGLRKSAPGPFGPALIFEDEWIDERTYDGNRHDDRTRPDE